MSFWNGPKCLIVVEISKRIKTVVYGIDVEVEVKQRSLHPDCPYGGRVVAGPFTDPNEISEAQATCDRWNLNQLK